MGKSNTPLLTSILLVLAIVSTGCHKDQGLVGGGGPSEDQYINFTIGTTTINFSSASGSDTLATNNILTNINFTASPTTFVDSSSWRFTSFDIVNVTGVGTFTLDPSSLIVTKGIGSHTTADYTDHGTITVNITQFGSAGGYVAGNFSGAFQANGSGALVNGTCNFKVKKDF